MQVKTMAELMSEGKEPDILFWVGCAGSFDDRAKKITKAIIKILNHVGINYAVLGTEESCTGDPAKRSGNEFLFQMQAFQIIEIFKMYNIKNIVTACPHCFNIFKNEYSELGAEINVLHHSQYIQKLIDDKKLVIEDNGTFKGKKIAFHDPCYLGRGNNIYEAPRELIQKLDSELVEYRSCKSKALCCGAGGAQIFKEAEKGNKEIHIERAEQTIETKCNIVATACPFCNTMITDGLKMKEKEEIKVYDLAELIAISAGL